VPKKEIPEDEGPSQAWLASYADAMTLLLAFFIMMFAFALIDEGKYFDFKVGVQAVFGLPDPVTDNTESILAEGTGFAPELGPTPIPLDEEALAAAEEAIEDLTETGTVTPENAEQLRQLLETEFAQLGAAELVEVGIDERGVFIRFDGRVLFASGSAELDDEGLPVLATAAQVLGVVDNMLEIEGHTDNRPTGRTWASNWELSAARAARVVRWLIDPGGLPDPQLVAVGRADTRPRADNTTSEGRQQNRRVEIVIRVAGIAESDTPVIDPLDDGLEELDDVIGVDPLDAGTQDGTADATTGTGVTDGTEPADGGTGDAGQQSAGGN
jgi:chemotaxis protein MotB